MNRISQLVFFLVVTTVLLSSLNLPSSSLLYLVTNDGLVTLFLVNKNQRQCNDSSIVIVNIKNNTPELIKKQVEIIELFKPKVIGVDLLFEDYTLVENSSSQKISSENIVFPSIIHDYENSKKDNYDSIIYSANYLADSVFYGFTNSNSGISFSVTKKVKDQVHFSFATQIVRLYNDKLFKSIIDRNDENAYINFCGNLHSFIYLNDLTRNATKEDLELIEDKIVLVGYLGDQEIPITNNDQDIIHTPYYYMYGVVYIANILHTLLQDPILKIHRSINIAVIILLAFMNTYLTNLISKKKFTYAILKLVQIGEILIFFLLSFVLLNSLNLLLNYQMAVISILLSIEICYWYYKLRINEFLI